MNLKQLLELRAKKQAEMKAIIDGAGEQQRALNTEERENFDKLDGEIRELDETISRIQSFRNLDSYVEEEGTAEEPSEGAQAEEQTVEQREYRAFDAYIRGISHIETRDGALSTEVPMKKSENGAIIPDTIANKIITKVVDICPIYQDATKYNVPGTLQIPYYDESTGDITMEYADEFSDGESKSGKFKSISLKAYLARAITDISKSLINNSQFDVVDFVVTRMAEQIARFIEHELLIGTTDKVEGLSGVTQIVTAESSTALTADELIDLQEAVPDAYQTNAYFVMNRATRTSIRKLKDGQGNYLLNKDANARWGYTLFGKDVYCSDNMPKIAAGNTVVYYGDYTGLAVKVSEEINIEILREIKAKHHAVEALGFVEFDSKVENAQKIAKLKMKS